MDLVKMKAIAIGTVVGDVVNQLGEVNTGCIVHVDPDNSNEDGRYSDPLVTEDVAKKLEAGGFAKRAGKAKFEKGFLTIGGAVDEETEGRVREISKTDTKFGGGTSALQTRNSVAFADGDAVRGGQAGLDGGEGDDLDDDDDAPPVPSKEPTPEENEAVAKPAAKPKAAAQSK